jgi:hypothetical protein
MLSVELIENGECLAIADTDHLAGDGPLLRRDRQAKDGGKAIAGDAESLKKASALQESIITVMLDNPSCVTQIRNLLANGYAIEFSVQKRSPEKPQFSDESSPLIA